MRHIYTMYFDKSESCRSFCDCFVTCTIYYSSLMPQHPLIPSQALLASLGQFYGPFFALTFSVSSVGSLVLSLLGSYGLARW